MSSVTPIDLPIDAATRRALGRGELVAERSVTRRTKKRLTSRGATIASLIIALL
jgi:alpha-glucoside transport system permease protein